MHRILAVLGWLVLLPAAIPILAATIDRLHPALDSLGVGLLYGLAAALIGLATLSLARAWVGAALGCTLILAALVQLHPATGLGQSRPTAQPLHLLQHNLQFGNAATDLTQRIVDADIVALQEISAARPALDALPNNWAAHTCPYASVGEPGLLTRLPITDRGCLDGGAWLRVTTDHGPVTFVSLHLRWPWPYEQADQAELNLPRLAALPRPIVLAGDFNQTPWSATVARIAQATETAPIPSLATTLPLKRGLIQLNIDHVLIPKTWSGTLTVTETHGSDHKAQIALIGPAEPAT